MKRFAVFMLAIVAGITLLAGNSQAAFIKGDLKLVGLVDLYKFENANNTGTLLASNIEDADKVDFVGGSIFGNTFTNDQALVLEKTEDFSFSSQSTATINDFVFNPVAFPIALWEYDGFSFSMTSLKVERNAANTSLTLSGDGLVSKVGFDATFGDWIFTTNATATDSNGKFSWSSSSSVPEPASTAMIFIGAGVVGLGGLVRGRKTKK